MTTWTRADALEIRRIMDNMGVCSCGSGVFWPTIKQILTVGESEKEDFYKSTTARQQHWMEFGALVADSWGLLEHGSSIGGAWLTQDGALLLRFLRDFSDDQDNHPEWCHCFEWNELEVRNDTFAKWLASTKGKS